MCTSIVEVVAAEGMAKRGDDWFPLTHSVVAYDHARHALLADAITIDFINRDLPPGARAAVELTLESAKALHAALDKAIAEAEIEETERLEGIERARRGNMEPSFAQRFSRAVAEMGAPSRQPDVAAETVLGDYGFGPAEIAALRKDAVTGTIKADG